MLTIDNLSVRVGENKVLDSVSLKFEKGKNYCILGKNGSGKSSLALSVMGHPSYEVIGGQILLDGESLNDISADQRSQKGIFLAFQTIPEIKGVKLFEFLRSVSSAHAGKQYSFIQFKALVLPLMDELGIPHDFLRREVNVGFSGGEKRKIEVLQLRLLNPSTIFLDEVDSGLDVDGFKQVAGLMKQLNTEQNSFIIITHYFHILEYLPLDWVYVLDKGKIVLEGDKNLIQKVQEGGFAKLLGDQ